jgi:hypothetical protein
VVYAGTLRDWADNHATALDDPVPGAGATWTTGTTRSYKFTVTTRDDNAAQGLTATQAFTWEARNSSPTSWHEPVSGAIASDPARDTTDPVVASIGGRLWVAWREHDGTNWEVRAARLNPAGTAWDEVGGGASPINYSATHDADAIDLAGVNGLPHLAWKEHDGTNSEVRVARLNTAGSGWEQVVGGASPINHSATRDVGEYEAGPRLAERDGVPWVVWDEEDGTGRDKVRVSRLNTAGTAWAQVVGGANPINYANEQGSVPDIAMVGGTPYVCWTEWDGVNYEMRVAKLNAAEDDWLPVVTGASPLNANPSGDGWYCDMSGVGSTPYVAFGQYDPSWDLQELRVSKLNAGGTAWQALPTPPVAPPSWADTPSLSLIGSRLHLTWAEGVGGQDRVRVTRLNAAATAWDRLGRRGLRRPHRRRLGADTRQPRGYPVGGLGDGHRPEPGRPRQPPLTGAHGRRRPSCVSHPLASAPTYQASEPNARRFVEPCGQSASVPLASTRYHQTARTPLPAGWRVTG